MFQYVGLGVVGSGGDGGRGGVLCGVERVRGGWGLRDVYTHHPLPCTLYPLPCLHYWGGEGFSSNDIAGLLPTRPVIGRESEQRGSAHVWFNYQRQHDGHPFRLVAQSNKRRVSVWKFDFLSSVKMGCCPSE